MIIHFKINIMETNKKQKIDYSKDIPPHHYNCGKKIVEFETHEEMTARLKRQLGEEGYKEWSKQLNNL